MRIIKHCIWPIMVAENFLYFPGCSKNIEMSSTVTPNSSMLVTDVNNDYGSPHKY